MIRRRRASLALGAAMLPLLAGSALALPTGGVVTGANGGGVVITGGTGGGTLVNGGTADGQTGGIVNTGGSVMTVQSYAHRSIIDWKSFSVGSAETVNFVLPDKNAIVVNRQLTGAASLINGAINSTVSSTDLNYTQGAYYSAGSVGGSVWIINPNGVVFGPNAAVNVGGLLASTVNLVNDKDFLSASDTAPISFSGGSAGASIALQSGSVIKVNDGTAAFFGDVIAAAGTVTGQGSFASGTKAIYGAGARAFTIRFSAAPPDPLRATDLALFDYVVDGAGSALAGLSYGPGANTTAGQVILDLQADPTALAQGVDRTLSISGGSIAATGVRGDGDDLMVLAGNVKSGAPVGGSLGSRVELSIGQDSTSASLSSAGGLYLGGDAVYAGLPDQANAHFKVAGQSRIYANDIALQNTAGPGFAPTLDTGTGLGSGSGRATRVVVNDQYHPTVLGDVSTLGVISIQNVGAVTAGALSGASGITVISGGALKLGDNSSQGAVALTATGPLSAGGLTGASIVAVASGSTDASLTLSGPVAATSGGVLLSSTGALTAPQRIVGSQFVHLTSQAGITAGDLTSGKGAVSLTSGGALLAGNLAGRTAVVFAAAGPATVGDLAATAGPVSAQSEGSLTAGALTGQAVAAGAGYGFSVFGTDAPIANAHGDLRIAGPITATTGGIALYDGSGSLNVSGKTAGVSTLTITDAGGSVAMGDIASAGAIALQANGDAAVGVLSAPTVQVQAAGAVTLGGAQAGDLQVASGLPIYSKAASSAPLSVTGPVVLQTSGDFTAGGQFSAKAPISVVAAASGGGLTVTANTVDIAAPITAAGAGGGAATLSLISSNPLGVALGDNLSGAAGLYAISGKTFGLLNASTVVIGMAEDSRGVTGAVFRVGDLTVNAAKTGSVVVGDTYAQPAPLASPTLVIEGTVTGIGAPGFGDVPSGPGVWAPNLITVSGAIGSATGPAGAVQLTAGQNILLGSQPFIAAFNPAADPATLPSSRYVQGYGGLPTGYAFIDAATVNLSATKAIMQQDTAPAGGGLIVKGALVIGNTPRRVDLFGEVPDSHGAPALGYRAAQSSNIVLASAKTSQPTDDFNACQIGVSSNCLQSPGAVANLRAPDTSLSVAPPADAPPSPDSSTADAAGAGVSEQTSTTGDFTAAARADRADSGQGRGGPASGVANESLWPAAGP